MTIRNAPLIAETVSIVHHPVAMVKQPSTSCSAMTVEVASGVGSGSPASASSAALVSRDAQSFSITQMAFSRAAAMSSLGQECGAATNRR